jgi:hypothetical protein
MSLTNVRPKYIDDFVVQEDFNARDEVTFKNNSGGTDSWNVGRTLVLSGSYYVPATVNHADCVLLTNTGSLANNATMKVAVIGLRGECILNMDALEYGDGGTAFDADAAAQVTELSSQGVKFQQEPDTSATG